VEATGAHSRCRGRDRSAARVAVQSVRKACEGSTPIAWRVGTQHARLLTVATIDAVTRIVIAPLATGGVTV
jgi:hypothetical protein